jgi:hypothetical protein
MGSRRQKKEGVEFGCGMFQRANLIMYDFEHRKLYKNVEEQVNAFVYPDVAAVITKQMSGSLVRIKSHSEIQIRRSLKLKKPDE